MSEIPDEVKECLWNGLQAAFALWKIDYGEKAPTPRGLLSIPIDPKTAEPFLLAGPGAANTIDLALKLWAEAYPPFLEVVEKVGIGAVLRVILFYDAHRLNGRSVSAAKEVLHRLSHIAAKSEREYLTPLAAEGLKFKQKQKERAKKSRGIIQTDDGRLTIKQVVRSLVASPEHADCSAKELWRPFHAELEVRHLDPIEVEVPGDIRKSAYSYSINGEQRKSMTFGRFEALVSEIRNEKSR